MAKKPRKPTDPFGHIAFGKSGSVTKHMSQLSHEKEEQEVGVMEHFITAFNQLSGQVQISSLEQLAEAGHDFVALLNDSRITIQVTELVELDYAKPIPEEEYNKGIYNQYIQKTSGEIPWAVDKILLASSLRRSIEKKIKKNYAKADSEIMWLLVFCTSPYVLTEYVQGGQHMISETLAEARKYLAEVNICVFDEIWFTNLQTRPVRVWPVSGKMER